MPKEKVTNEDLAAMMQNEFSSINEKFENIDKKFEGLSEVFTTKEELKQTKKELMENLATKEDVDKILTAVDGYKKQVKDEKDERLSLGNKVERNEKNIATLAESTGTEIE